MSEDPYATLAEGGPAERAEVVLGLIEAHPEGLLALAGRDGSAAMLDGVDLGRRTLARRTGAAGSAWWDAGRRGARLSRAELDGARLRRCNLAGADLSRAGLRGALLGGADLREANLEGADLRGADLACTRLARATLGQADLREALLEEADLRGASMRFAQLDGATLEGANLTGADLWSARFDGAILTGVRLRDAVLKEAHLRGANLAGADLRRAELSKADLRDTDLSGADLRLAAIAGADLRGAVLARTRLDGLDLTGCRVEHAHFADVILRRTRIGREQLGDAIAEETAGRYDDAARGYQALERNFSDLGDPDASSWAYRRRRRMQKLAARRLAGAALAERRFRDAAELSARYLSDQVVEWLCDYGESVPRVLMSMLLLYVLFTVAYGATGSVVRVHEASGHQVRRPTRDPLDLAIFSLMAMTTSGSPAVGLEPRNESVHLLTGLQASLGIGLTGLLGFVLGNRVRR